LTRAVQAEHLRKSLNEAKARGVTGTRWRRASFALAPTLAFRRPQTMARKHFLGVANRTMGCALAGLVRAAMAP